MTEEKEAKADPKDDDEAANGATPIEENKAGNSFLRMLNTPLPFGNAVVLILVIFAIVLFVKISGKSSGDQHGIHNTEYARGLITLIFAGGTMLIAVILSIYIITSASEKADKRFTQGKEILTILIGVFGTILGFYFGKTTVSKDTPKEQLQKNSSTNTATPPSTEPPKPKEQTKPIPNGGNPEKGED